MPISNFLQPGCCCGGGTPPPGKTFVTGCSCSPAPININMTSSDHVVSGGLYHDAAFIFGPPPAAAAPYITFVNQNQWYSTTTFNDGFGDYYFMIACNLPILGVSDGSELLLYQIYVTGGITGVSGYYYRWDIGAPNTCNPFSFTFGAAFPPGFGPVILTLS